MEDFQSKYSGEQVEEFLDQIANGEVGGGASVYTWEWDGNEQGSVADEVFTSIYNSDVLYLRYAGMDIPAIIARAEQTIIILASIQAGDSLLNIKVTFTGWNYTAEIISTEIGDGGGNVYKWRWNNEMTGTFTEEEFESIKNAGVIYISVNVAGMEATYYVDTKWEIENTLQIGSSVLVLEDDTGSSFVASLQNIAFTFDNTSKIWNALVGGAELISNEQLASALENKQDTIEDLEEIRQGAAKGNTALQKDAIFNWEIPIDDDGSFIPGGELTEEEYNRLKNSDIVFIRGVVAGRQGDELFCLFGIETLVVYIGTDGGAYYYSAVSFSTEIPTKTSQLENDSNFVSSDNLRTINGQSIVGSGDIEIDAITVETDPVFSASPAASITEEKKAEWDGKYTKPSGGIPASDLASDVFLQGEKGEQGEQGQKGDDGVGIASVVQTTTSSADGGSNVMTVTLSNGTKSTFTVKNGSKGSQGVQGPKGDTGADGPKGDKGDKGDTGANGTNGKDGADGEDGATFTPSVDANGNLSWTNNKGLSNPPTVNIKGPKGDSGEGGGSGGGNSAYPEVHHGTSDTIFTLTPNTFHVWDEVGKLHLSFGDPIEGMVNEYIFQFSSPHSKATALSIPGLILWPEDGELIIEQGKTYIISVVNNFGVFVKYRLPLGTDPV